MSVPYRECIGSATQNEKMTMRSRTVLDLFLQVTLQYHLELELVRNRVNWYIQQQHAYHYAILTHLSHLVFSTFQNSLWFLI